MKRAKLLTVLILTTGLTISSLTAQEKKPVSLQEAVQIALDNNLKIKSSSLSVEALKSLKASSWDIGKTDVDLEYGQLNSALKDNNLSVSQSISFPLVYINQARLAGARIRSGEWQHQGTKLEIATQVKQVYWQLNYLYSKRRLLAYQDSLYSLFLRAAELRSQTGETNRLEMITARSQSLEIRNQLNQIRLETGIAERNLRTILNTDTYFIPSDSILKKAGGSTFPDSATITGNPSLSYLEQQVEVMRREKMLEKSRALPDLKFGYFNQSIRGVQEINGQPQAFGPGDRFTGISAGISLPLWFTPYTSRARSARLNEKVAASDAEYYSRSLAATYCSLIDEFKKYSGSVNYYESQALREADMIIDQSTKSYKAGAMDYLEYVLSLGRALEIKQNYLDAVNSLNQTLVNIDFVTGKIF